ncbi:hypothetical protein BD311DRAFT_768897 [Dichomitus squalens]|uniref:Uncharacterized protein n=1 Tax=Dichomitus squalens TaxID=114155 RepID=A0A4Q9M812_9APHY|nr:hypothetical protein BD311DRAFT_768897 [Dichomitus squalens]
MYARWWTQSIRILPAGCDDAGVSFRSSITASCGKGAARQGMPEAVLRLPREHVRITEQQKLRPLLRSAAQGTGACVQYTGAEITTVQAVRQAACLDGQGCDMRSLPGILLFGVAQMTCNLPSAFHRASDGMLWLDFKLACCRGEQASSRCAWWWELDFRTLWPCAGA